MQETGQYSEDRLSGWVIWLGGFALCAGIAGAFWFVWKSQFAAPSGFLFGSPTQEIEAGYCLGVAQQVVPGGSPTGGFVSETTDFWIKRLRSYTRDMGPPIAAAQARIARDLQASLGGEREWLEEAMITCTKRAQTYGAKFQTLK